MESKAGEMMKRRGSTVAILALLTAAPAAADILVWRDAAGVSHYTNDLANVPPEFRGDAITVAKDWARAEPPPEAVAPAVVNAAAEVAPQAAEAPHPAEVYQAAYEAGLRAGEENVPANPPAAVANVGPVVQAVEVHEAAPESRWSRLLPFGFLTGRKEPTPVPRDERSEREKRFPPAQPAPFLQGPAGPPPVNFGR
jgi:hypothetical protein